MSEPGWLTSIPRAMTGLRAKWHSVSPLLLVTRGGRLTPGLTDRSGKGGCGRKRVKAPMLENAPLIERLKRGGAHHAAAGDLPLSTFPGELGPEDRPTGQLVAKRILPDQLEAELHGRRRTPEDVSGAIDPLANDSARLFSLENSHQL